MLGRDTRTQTDDDQRRPSRWRRAAVAVGILLPAAAVPATPASAASGCTSPAAFSAFDGAHATDATNVNGAYGYITYEPVSICADVAAADSSTGSLDWVMVAQPGTTSHYAQTGYFRDQHFTAPVLFAEYNDGGCSETSCTTTAYHWTRKLFTTTFTLHGSNKFAVGLTYDAKALNMLVNDQVILTTPWDPHTAWIASGWEAQFMGETWDVGDDMPGTATYPAKFRGLTTWGATSGIGPATLVPGGITGSPFYNRTIYTNNGGMDIWTDRSGGGGVPISGH